MQKEIPILFKTDMVQALIAGTKTQTRRVVKGTPNDISREDLLIRLNGAGINHKHINCPYGKVGDLLWVRETFGIDFMHIDDQGNKEVVYGYKASNGDCADWHPSIHMPKDAARIWLQVTNVGVERLKHISNADCIAEGIEVNKDALMFKYKNYAKAKHPVRPFRSSRASYSSLWISINGFDSWDDDPWVWVISFKVLSTTGKPQSALN